ncbi:hypothetical protein H0H87_004513 [Tephrocybe sp. NHM501043]|nr:hypothetical protein H0H87_004513 [Tephrocybe sp. NHM501043]
MASALNNACAAGDLDAVRDILAAAAAAADIELQGEQRPWPRPHCDSPLADQHGVTPLIEAVRNGHIEVVRALLDKGADPTHASAEGLPETYTSDTAIVDLLRFTAASRAQQAFAADASAGPGPAPYAYYPPDGGAYFPPASGPEVAGPGGVGHLPPPDIARLIPCRYFPACRYGAACMFAHPHQYFPGSLPPPPPFVAPYDPMNVQHYSPNYFPPPPFQPNGVLPMSPPTHGPSPSEVGLPPAQPPFSPNSLSPAPYLSPNPYPHPGQTPVPIMMSPLPPPPAPMYNNAPPSAPSYVPHDGPAPYPVPLVSKPNIPPQDFNADTKPLEAPGPNNHHPIRDGSGPRRGGPRRPSFNANGRKPPCLFFPSGRCKNGDDCRYPHVAPDPNNHVPYFAANRGPRPPRQPNGNGIAHLNEKLAGLNVRDDAQRNGADAPPNRSHSESNGRPRFNNGNKNGYHHQNGARPEKRPPPFKQQRVPNADEFPVLAGSVTPPARSTNGLPNGNGPTAAQVLSAPAPFRPREASSKDPSTRGTSPDPAAKSAAPKAEPNGVTPEIAAPATTTTTTSIDQPPVAVKLPISFAAVTAAPSELPKEIALSA